MPKPRKIIDIFPPQKLEKDYHFLAAEETKEKKKIIKVERKKGSRVKAGLVFLFLFLIAGVIFLHFVLAKVNIEIWPETQNLNLNEQLSVDANAKQSEFASKMIVGKSFEVEKSAVQQFNSTGKLTKETNAQGMIRVYNNSNIAQTLVATTRFQPALDKVIYFRTTKKIVVPAKSYLDVEVRADRAGEEYNIGPATFSVPGLAGGSQYYSVYGKSSSQMTGGFKGLVNQVKQEDLDVAQKTLSEKIKNDSKNYFAEQSGEDFVFLDEGMSQEILEASSSVPAGGAADSFNFNLKIKTRAVAFKKSDLDNFVKDLTESRIQNSNEKVEEQSLKVDSSVQGADIKAGKIILNLKISATAYSDIEQETLKKALFGKSIKESQLLLENQPAIIKSSVEVFPPWLNKIPESESKIKIKLNID